MRSVRRRCLPLKLTDCRMERIRTKNTPESVIATLGLAPNSKRIWPLLHEDAFYLQITLLDPRPQLPFIETWLGPQTNR